MPHKRKLQNLMLFMERSMRCAALLIGIVFGLVFSAQAIAEYDPSWYKANFWTGEWPFGFAVVNRGISVPARTNMDKDLKPPIDCKLPYGAVFHPWNTKRNKLSKAEYWTASKIRKMGCNGYCMFLDDKVQFEIKNEEIVEYLVYLGEGYFKFRFRGKIYTGDQSFFANLVKLDPTEDKDPDDEEWLKLTCGDGSTGWILINDLETTDDSGKRVYMKGILRSDWPGRTTGVLEYGRVRDLKKSELELIARGITD